MKRKILIASSILAALLVLPPLAAWWYVFHTQAGVNLAIAQLDRLKNIRITVDGVSGTLAGPLVVRRFELDDKHVNVVAEDIRVELTSLALLAQTIRVDTVSIARANVQLKTFSDEPTANPPRFFPSFLRLSVGNAIVDDARVTTAQGMTIAASPAHCALTLTSQRLEITDAHAESQAMSATGRYTLQAKRPVEMRFVGSVRAPGGRGVELTSDVDFSGTPASFRIKGQLTAPSAATFAATLIRETDAWRTVGTIESAVFPLTPWIESAPFSLRDAKLTLAATNGDVRVQGTVNVPELDRQPIAVDAQGHYADRTLFIAPIELKPLDSDVAVTARGQIKITDDRPLITAQAEWINFRWPLRDSVFVSPRGRLTLQGDLPYSIDVNGDARLNNGISGTVAASGELSNAALRLKRYSLAMLGGKATGQAQLAFGAPWPWQVSTTATNIDLAPLHDKLRSSLRLDAQARGTGLGRDASFALNVHSIRGTLFDQRLTASGALERHSSSGGDTWRARNIAANLGDDRLELNGDFGQQHDLAWRVDIGALERFVNNTHGSIHTQGALRGRRDAPVIDAQVDGRFLEYGAWRAESLSIDANVNLAAASESSLVAKAQRVGWDDQRFDEMRVIGKGTTESHTIELQADFPADSRTQLAGMNVSASGTYANKSWRGSIAPVQLIDRQSGAPTLQAPSASAQASIAAGRVDAWCVLWVDRKMCGHGNWRDGAWNVAIQSDPMPLRMFDELLGDDARLNGTWQLQANARAARDKPWTADAALLMTDAKLAYQPIEGAEEVVQLGSGRANFAATSSQFRAALTLATPGTTNLDAEVQVERTQDDAKIGDAPLSGTLRASTSDANLLPLLLVDLDHAAGSLRIDLQARGTLGSPALFGDIELAQGELDMYRYNLTLREMGVTARIDDNRVRFNGSGRAGEGVLRIDGELAWRDNGTAGTINFKGDRLLVSDVPDYRVVASPDVRFAIDGMRIDVTGDVLIPSANIQPVDLRGAVQRSSDVRLINEVPLETDRGFTVFSNVNVRLGNDVKLDTYGLTGRLGGAVTAITRPNETPRGRGELSVTDGQYEAYGQNLEIERGRLLFDAAPLDNPGLDILAIRRVEDQRVGVNVRGTLRAPRMTLYAEPSLPQTQIVAYLLTGKPVEDMRSSDATAVGNATDALALQGGSLLASQLGRRIGLEHVSVESRGLDDTSLVLGKFLSPRLFVSYGISLTESFNTLKARYTISDRWLFKTEAGQDQSADVEFRIER